ncbi:mycothiol conjugate amidase Mca [Streptomyces aurantiacus]|uniref:Mycothiol S-conjugate amidase n=1 Tax=Streptomyces aurantiacus TaxID=47760 RepID=A0A7G1P0G5_9ACTN|nr:mycothiol conjugate amidase Mca [Streptomyces aurantiacus]BCL28739.1 mycothiol S-conjugate amidase [Streptomyces aurantiacus]
MPNTLRLMAVHAHPDDESSKGAATLARYVTEGVEVLVVTCTGGERGDILNPHLADADRLLADLGAERRREMAAAQKILGVEHAWLGFVDSGMPDSGPLPPGCFAALPVPEAAGPLVALMRAFRPHVVTTYDETGGYPHPDHLMSHRVSVHAFETAADPDRYPAAGPPWQPLKLYYSRTLSRARASALRYATRVAGRPPVSIWSEGAEQPDRPEFTTRVACADWFDVRDAALKAHATQIDPEGFWFSVPNDVQRQAWPTEDYELARTLVPTPPAEDDLFAGLRSPVADHHVHEHDRRVSQQNS